MRQFVPNFLSYVSVKYYLVYSWESYHKNKKVNFLLRQRVR